MTFLWQYIDLDPELVALIKDKCKDIIFRGNIVEKINIGLTHLFDCEILYCLLVTAEPGLSSSIHRDYYADDYYPEKGRLAINIPIDNCEKGITEFFYPFEEHQSSFRKEKTYVTPVDVFNSNTSIKISEYVLNKPVVLNTRVPHRFTNFGKKRRIAASLRFKKIDPWHLITYN